MKNRYKVAAILACRIGSTRLFGKPLQRIGKFTILELQIRQIKKSKMISDIVLAISENKGNEVFVEFAQNHKLKYVIGGEKDVLKRFIKAANLVDADIVFRVSTENPYLHWEEIDPTLRKHIKLKCDFSTLEPIPLGAGFHIINTKALEKSFKNGTSRHHSEHVNLYINEHKEKFRSRIFNPKKVFQRSDIRLTVDTPEDLILVRKIYDAVGDNGKPIPFKKIIKFLDKNPELILINADIPREKKFMV